MKVALFSSCIVDLLKPEIGFATLRLLEAAGCDVEVPEQSCCGQANYNSGDEAGARAMLRNWQQRFAPYDYIVIPSGSCAAMLKHHAPALFADSDQSLRKQSLALAEKSYELSQFLTEVVAPEFGELPLQKICYHDSWSGLRDLGIKQQPRQLLSRTGGLELLELPNAEACCGFGGTFSVKHPEVSCRLADDKIAGIEASGADTLVGGDWSCLMHLQGRLQARGIPLQVKHFSELLVQALDNGEPT